VSADQVHAGEHHHDHHDHPLESITHVHGGAMVLDIGGTVGALHVLLDDEWAGQELFLAGGEAAVDVHTGVWLRHAGSDRVATALFGALEAGRYRVLARDRRVWRRVDVRGGELTELDLRVSVAARVAPGR
jgi:hypothetical protein